MRYTFSDIVRLSRFRNTLQHFRPECHSRPVSAVRIPNGSQLSPRRCLRAAASACVLFLESDTRSWQHTFNTHRPSTQVPSPTSRGSPCKLHPNFVCSALTAGLNIAVSLNLNLELISAPPGPRPSTTPPSSPTTPLPSSCHLTSPKHQPTSSQRSHRSYSPLRLPRLNPLPRLSRTCSHDG